MLGCNAAENVMRKPIPSKPLKRMMMRKIFKCQLAVAQSIYNTVHLSGIHGNVNKPCPQAVAIGLSWFTAINPANYTVTITCAHLFTL